MNYTTEGCFCPDGMKLFNKDSGVCVDKCGKCGVYSQVLLLNYIYCIPYYINLEMLSFQQDVLILREFPERWVFYWSDIILTCDVYMKDTIESQLLFNLLV